MRRASPESCQMTLLDYLEPLRDKLSSKSAYLGLVVAAVMYSFSMFLPWASVRGGIRPIHGGSASGWSEFAFIAILPIVPSVFMILAKSKPTKIIVLLSCIMACLLLLAYNNIMNRAEWVSVARPWDVSGSELGVGFWLGTLALVFSLGWTLHNLPAASGVFPAIKS
jgi:hypothetical protein